MRKVLAILTVFIVLVSWLGCFIYPEKTYSNIDDYHMLYDNVENANKTFTKEGQRDTLLSWREYSYCSYMLLFPREQPEKIKEFQYYWLPIIDYDDYATYFSYELSESEFENFRYELDNFTLSYGEQTNKLYYSEDCFEYPAYIITWGVSSEGEEYDGVFEYILLDESTNTIINVYSMSYSLEKLQEKAQYNILPKNNDFYAVEDLLEKEPTYCFAKSINHTIYAFYDEDGEMFVPSLEEIEFNRYFVDHPEPSSNINA